MNNEPLFTLFHSSDLHFKHYPKRLSSYLSKRLQGYANNFFNPWRRFDHSRLDAIKPILEKHRPKYFLITGDLTVAEGDEEFQAAREWIQSLDDLEMELLILPGNHDLFIRRERNKGFFSFLESIKGKAYTNQLFDYNFVTTKLSEEWLWIGMDNSRPTPWGKAHGFFDDEHQKQLSRFLNHNSQKHILLSGHYPWSPTSSQKNDLIGYQKLRDTVRSFPQVKLYLHGHTHYQRVKYEKSSGLCPSIESGSTCDHYNSSFMLIHLWTDRLSIQPYNYNHLNQSWESIKQIIHYSW
jgi:3',5'-cyclic AMP phosphodiesterase CpdA